jgi:hypothetical protein
LQKKKKKLNWKCCSFIFPNPSYSYVIHSSQASRSSLESLFETSTHILRMHCLHIHLECLWCSTCWICILCCHCELYLIPEEPSHTSVEFFNCLLATNLLCCILKRHICINWCFLRIVTENGYMAE